MTSNLDYSETAAAYPGILQPQTFVERCIRKFIYWRQRKTGGYCDAVIEGFGDKPAMYRWHVLPRNAWFNVYLHKIMQDDEQDLHDHPYHNMSVPLVQGYLEVQFRELPVYGSPHPALRVRSRRILRPFFRLASTPHQILVMRDEKSRPLPAWSLFVTGPRVRHWGFWQSGRDGMSWRSWREYVTTRGELRDDQT